MQTLRETIAAVGALAAFLAKPAFGKRRASAIVQLEQASGGRLGVFALIWKRAEASHIALANASS